MPGASLGRMLNSTRRAKLAKLMHFRSFEFRTTRRRWSPLAISLLVEAKREPSQSLRAASDGVSERNKGEALFCEAAVEVRRRDGG